MKYEVIKSFSDRITHCLRMSGDIVEYEGERAKELKAGGYIKEIKADEKKK